MTVVNPKSISGINSITTGSGSDNLLTIHTNEGTERVRVDSTGTTKIVTGIVTTLTATGSAKVGTGITLSSDGDVFVTGVTTSTTVKVGGGVTISESGIEASGIGITCANINGAQIGGRRNFVINGEARVAQRGTVTDHGTTAKYTAVDRFKTRIGSSYNFDVTSSQSTDAPVGFSNSLKLSPDSTSTPPDTDNGALCMILEGQDLQGFGFGTSSAKPMTLSFYAKSGSAGAGTYSIDMHYINSGNGANQQTRAFTITSSWQRFIFTFEGNGTATSEAIRNTTSEGLRIIWHLASGPDDKTSAITTWTTTASMKTITGMDNFMSSTSNEFYITGVQLEIGSHATAFEHRTFGDELSLCQRYCRVLTASDATTAYFAPAYLYTNTSVRSVIVLNPEMRTTPTIVCTSATNNYRFYRNGTYDGLDDFLISSSSKRCAHIYNSTDISGTAGQAGSLYIASSSTGFISLEAEL